MKIIHRQCIFFSFLFFKKSRLRHKNKMCECDLKTARSAHAQSGGSKERGAVWSGSASRFSSRLIAIWPRYWVFLELETRYVAMGWRGTWFRTFEIEIGVKLGMYFRCFCSRRDLGSGGRLCPRVVLEGNGRDCAPLLLCPEILKGLLVQGIRRGREGRHRARKSLRFP